jgi:imidazolonepropionase-like amidohydrolase
MAHGRGALVTAHSGRLGGAIEGVKGGVDSIEHGFELDEDVAAEMAERRIFLVSTLAVMRSWMSFGRTTTIPRFATDDGRRTILARQERAIESVRLAHRAGVPIASGTDFGGGSLRANQLAWEVEALVEAGLEPWQALAAATWRGGELLHEEAAGTISEGGPADFFLVHGDPLTEPSALWRIWRVAWAG